MSVTRSTPKVVVVMPAYNAGRTLRLTYEELPKDTVNLVILVDDASTDATLDVARQLGLEIFVHRSEEHTSELQSRLHLVCRLLLEKKKIAPTTTALARRNTLYVAL